MKKTGTGGTETRTRAPTADCEDGAGLRLCGCGMQARAGMMMCAFCFSDDFEILFIVVVGVVGNDLLPCRMVSTSFLGYDSEVVIVALARVFVPGYFGFANGVVGETGVLGFVPAGGGIVGLGFASWRSGFCLFHRFEEVGLGFWSLNLATCMGRLRLCGPLVLRGEIDRLWGRREWDLGLDESSVLAVEEDGVWRFQWRGNMFRGSHWCGRVYSRSR